MINGERQDSDDMTESRDPAMLAFHYLWIFFFFQFCEITDSLYCLRQFKWLLAIKGALNNIWWD